jgi:hypothetical protein
MTKDIDGATWFTEPKKDEPKIGGGIISPTGTVAFEDRDEYKKGKIGEQIVHAVLTQDGYELYESDKGRRHKVDWHGEKDGQKYWVEAKTKIPFMGFTGFNVSNYNVYKELFEQYNEDILVLFVDHVVKKIYGGFLFGYLDLQCEHRTWDKNPPAKRVWRVDDMIGYYDISDVRFQSQLEEIARLTHSSANEVPTYDTVDLQVR